MVLYIHNIKFVNGKNIKNESFIINFDDGSSTLRSARFIKNALGEKKLTIKIFANVSD